MFNTTGTKCCPGLWRSSVEVLKTFVVFYYDDMVCAIFNNEDGTKEYWSRKRGLYGLWCNDLAEYIKRHYGADIDSYQWVKDVRINFV